MNWRKYIDRDPRVLAGAPKIKGTRIGVELIVERLGDGWTVAELLEAYPHLSEEQVTACLRFAAECVSVSEIIEVPRSAA